MFNRCYKRIFSLNLKQLKALSQERLSNNAMRASRLVTIATLSLQSLVSYASVARRAGLFRYRLGIIITKKMNPNNETVLLPLLLKKKDCLIRIKIKGNRCSGKRLDAIKIVHNATTS